MRKKLDRIICNAPATRQELDRLEKAAIDSFVSRFETDCQEIEVVSDAYTTKGGKMKFSFTAYSL